jgi:hypothetical protein
MHAATHTDMHTDLASHHEPITVVLLDPTHRDGESVLGELGAADTHIALVVMLSGRTSAALREYAAAESIALADAGFIYLDQVAERVAAPGRAVETILATGPDAVHELALVASDRAVGRVVLPPSSHRLDRIAVARLHAELPTVEVVVAGLSPVR